MATNRTYGDACGVAHALDLVGQRWALLIVRELALGGKRYTDLLADLPGISTNVLSHRLAELENVGVVRRHKLPPPAAAAVYELTEWGGELGPVLASLARWGARSPLRRRDRHLSATAFMLSLKVNFAPDLASGVRHTCAFQFGEQRFGAAIEDHKLEIWRGAVERPDVVIDSSPSAVAAVVYSGRDLVDAVRAGDVSLHGSTSAAKRFVKSFRLPESAAAPSTRVPATRVVGGR